MRLFIPTIGSALRLTNDWHFSLQKEYRNSDLAKLVDEAGFEANVFQPHPDTHPHWWETTYDVVLPAGTVLGVDRIYIRKGISDFDSLTFFIRECPDKRFAAKKYGGTRKGSGRFWAKLDDVNQIECEIIQEIDR